MFLKYLRLENDEGIIRSIPFHSGLNLIVDETPSGTSGATGNNVGKTTVLRLIDFCFGGSPRDIYTDPENRKSEHQVVKDFLQTTNVLVTLTLTADLDDPLAKEICIERNFIPRKGMIRRINGRQMTEDEFMETLTEELFPGQYGKKPTLAQIIAHNIRYKDIGLSNTLRNVHPMTKDEEYEALHLYMLGCEFSQGSERQKLLAELRVENTFKTRLEAAQTRSAYEASLAVLMREIDALNVKKAAFHINQNFESDLGALDEVKYKISIETAALGRATLRHNLIMEAVQDINNNSAKIDVSQLKALYEEVSTRLSGVQKSFDDLLMFHNRMVEEKARYISKEIPQLNSEIVRRKSDLNLLLEQERDLVAKVSKSGSLEELEIVVGALNEKHRLRGEYETIIQQVTGVEGVIDQINRSLADIDDDLFSLNTQAAIQAQVNKFNKYFSEISKELYDEQYVLKFDVVKSRSGQRIYKFNTFNMNMSSGKKQGEISCFDIAYTLFADEENIPCLHFLLNDKKELMHDNQLTKIARLVERQNKHVQFVASILRDKLPAELNQDKYIVVKLSQNDMLFRIESSVS
ncbi:DUF2326 domain-containing protein [Dechloromonas denitrificans]|uniref:DUF2326 domain-containing protein n=1 Tax=Dechloromonas denitrificans TaxID=281362 RepID=UPI001CF8EAA3|nr:DUF2326 domain-containing protein [Dechloromonas denitrificans]UCV12082.1 DUF2326 domain-containing protein [Dechloromonas denitrificans]